jgi:protein O-mannosyl-transferase
MKNKFIILAFSFFILLIIAYSNHFNNGFYFDDYHTIIENTYVRSLSNIPQFFYDISTFGTMPDNRAYRPIVTTLNTIDYYLGNGEPKAFHISIFFTYLLLGILIFFMYRKLYQDVKWSFLSLLATTFFMLHTANAETINYIIMRSDSFSTLCIVFSLWLYMNKSYRKKQIYLFPAIIGIMTKEVGLMVVPLYFLYTLVYEKEWEINDKTKADKWIDTLKETIIPIVILTGFFVFTQVYFKDKSITNVKPPYSGIQYFFTQQYVIAQYIGNFIFPLDLSVDKDNTIIHNIINQKVLFGILLNITLISIGLISTKNKQLRTVAFGIFWFYITLAPTSSIRPFWQISNDHRTFLPYIGLVLSLFGCFSYLYEKYKHKINNIVLKSTVYFFIFMVFSLHAFGVYQRNKVWSNEETLWYDATIKAPNSSRVLMNYGLTQMSKGKYDVALDFFERAYKISPTWAHININMGVINNALGKKEEAEKYYLQAIQYQPLIADGYYYYAKYLYELKKYKEALDYMEKGIKIAPNHLNIVSFYPKVKLMAQESMEEKIKIIDHMLPENPKEVDYINQSLEYYKIGKFNECILACNKAIELNKNSTIAYNNICSAYNALKEWEKAEQACLKALETDPNFERAKNNLIWARKNK